MRNKNAGYILAGLELLALLQANSLWLAPFTTTTSNGFSHVLQITTGALSIILLALPVMGMLFIYRNKRWGFVFLAAFPLCCIFFGITALPGVSLLYGSHVKLNSLFTAFSNALVCAAAFWLFVSARSVFTRPGNEEFAQSREQ